MVCRNCDGLLPTYNGRNMGKGRSKSRMDYKWNTMGQHKSEEDGAPTGARTQDTQSFRETGSTN